MSDEGNEFVDRRRGIAEWSVSLAVSAWGLAAGICLATSWVVPAPPDALPGRMAAAGLDGRGPVRAVLTVIAATLLAAFVARPLARRLATARPWAWIAAAAALASALWPALADPFDAYVAVVMAAALALTVMLLRDIDARFTISDAIVVATALSVYVPLTTLFPHALPATLAFVSVLAVLLLRVVLATRSSEASSLFALAPAGMLLQVPALFGHSPAVSLLGLAIALGTPPILLIVVRRTESYRLLRDVAVKVVVPLFLVAYAQSFNPIAVDGTPRVNFFEDGHNLLPASEMLRGERPYRDIVPGHGLLADGLLDYFAMKLGASNIGSLLRCEWILGAFFPAAIYGLAIAATGSPAIALLATLLGIAMPVGGTPWIRDVGSIATVPWLRALPAMIALAFAVDAVRRRRTRSLAFAASLAVVAGVTSIEFGTYAAIAVVVAAFCLGSRAAIRAASIGFAAATLPILFVFTVCGFVVDFFRVSFVEVASLSPVYTMGFFAMSDRFAAWRGFPDALGLLFQTKTVWVAAWGVVAILTATGLAAQRSRRFDRLWILGVWSLAATLSYAERFNVYFMPVLPVLAATAVSILVRKRSTRSAGFALLCIVIVIAMPAHHLSTVAELHRGADPERADYVRLSATPRCAGALFRRDNVSKFLEVKEFVDLGLGRDETFLDFANIPILYFLLDKPDPVRQYEVSFYESRKLQEEVIARLERDRSVRAVLVRFSNLGYVDLDNVPNAARAPLVWRYIQDHFQPAYRTNGVEFWMRRDPR